MRSDPLRGHNSYHSTIKPCLNMSWDLVYSGLYDNIYSKTLTGHMEVSWYTVPMPRLVLNLDGCSNLPFENSSLTSLTANPHPGAVWGNCWSEKAQVTIRNVLVSLPAPTVMFQVPVNTPGYAWLSREAVHIFTVLHPFRLFILGPLDCCYSSSGITVVSLHFRKTGLVKVAVFDLKETLSLHHLRGLCAVRPVTYCCTSCESRAIRLLGMSHSQSSTNISTETHC